MESEGHLCGSLLLKLGLVQDVHDREPTRLSGVDLEDSVLFVACNPVRDHPASAVELGEVNLVDFDVVFLVFEVVSEDVVSLYSAHLLEARDEDLAAGDPACVVLVEAHRDHWSPLVPASFLQLLLDNVYTSLDSPTLDDFRVRIVGSLEDSVTQSSHA